MISKGFRAPWNKDGWSSQEAADEEHKKITNRVVDYDKLAAISANLIRQQLDLIRRKQIEVKRRKGNEIPKHLQITKEDLEFLLRANREVLACRGWVKQEKAEAKKKTRDSFVDPRGDEGEIEAEPNPIEGGWEADGRAGT